MGKIDQSLFNRCLWYALITKGFRRLTVRGEAFQRAFCKTLAEAESSGLELVWEPFKKYDSRSTEVNAALQAWDFVVDGIEDFLITFYPMVWGAIEPTAKPDDAVTFWERSGCDRETYLSLADVLLGFEGVECVREGA